MSDSDSDGLVDGDVVLRDGEGDVVLRLGVGVGDGDVDETVV